MGVRVPPLRIEVSDKSDRHGYPARRGAALSHFAGAIPKRDKGRDLQEIATANDHAGKLTALVDAGHATTDAQVAWTFLILMPLCFAPTSLFYFFSHSGQVTSLAPGTILACIIFLGMIILGRAPAMSATRVANYVSFAGAVALVIVVHLVGAIALGGGTEPSRALLSIPALLLMLGAASALAVLLRQNAVALPRALALMRWLLIGLSLLAVLNIRPFQGAWEKPVFPFSEPSHLALVLNPLLLHACVTSRGVSRALWIIGGLALAYISESLTMVVGMVVAGLVCLPVIGIATGGAILVIATTSLDLTYFTKRLDLGEDTRNLSALVYRQGWELVGDAMQRTSNWGVGFQQLGYAPFQSPSADVLYSILRDDANTRDGGFLMAKIVAEFGVIGCLIIVTYVLIAIRCALLIRRKTAQPAAIPPQVLFAWCVVCSFITEMFARDVGYFAGSVLLFLASLYILWEDHTAPSESTDVYSHSPPLHP